MHYGFIPPMEPGPFQGPEDSLRIISRLQRQFADNAKRTRMVREVKSLLADYEVDDILVAARRSLVRSAPSRISPHELHKLADEFNKAAPALQFLKDTPEATLSLFLEAFARVKPEKIYKSLGPTLPKFEKAARTLPMTEVDRLYASLLNLDLPKLTTQLVSELRTHLPRPAPAAPPPPPKKPFRIDFKL